MKDAMTTQEEIARNAIESSVNTRLRRITRILVIAMLVMFVITLVLGYFVFRNYQASVEQGTTLAQEVQVACEDPSRVTSGLGDLCAQADEVVEDSPITIEGPAGPSGEPGDDGEEGPRGPGPTAEQVEVAVTRYCAEGRCQGDDGQSATPEDVQVAVSLYCNANGQCRGQDGADGATGQDGAPGDQGPPPSADQVAAAVVAYCSTRNECRGATGAQGSPGDDGRGIVSVACEAMDVTTFVITYTDGTTQEVTCTTEPGTPEPPVEPDPTSPATEGTP